MVSVEDNELNWEIVEEVLKETGISVECAEDGIEAVNIINDESEDKYNLVLMDIQMPRMDGYTATKEIRTLPNNRKANIPIIAMIANVFEEDRKKALECGMNGHIVKPVDMKIIEKELRGIFKEEGK
ncbi:MAG: response regulator [Lachnospiraceae bacterium]